MDKELQQLSDLKERFAYMFAGPSLGFDVYRGWLPDFIEACEKIDAILGDDKIGFHFSQIKEKYGWSRYYFDTDKADLTRVSTRDAGGITETIFGLKDEHVIEKKIAAILFEIEKKSMTKCSVCAAPSTIRNFDGWHLCVCEKHEPQKRGEHHESALVR